MRSAAGARAGRLAGSGGAPVPPAPLRNTLWQTGYAVDTVETAAEWTRARARRWYQGGAGGGAGSEMSGSTSSPTCPTSIRTGTSIYATYVFRHATKPGGDAPTLAGALKTAASRGDRRARRDDQPPARCRSRPRSLPGGGEGRPRDGGPRRYRPRFDLDGLMDPAMLLGPRRDRRRATARARPAGHGVRRPRPRHRRGTQSLRALVFDPRGALVASAGSPSSPSLAPARAGPSRTPTSVGPPCAGPAGSWPTRPGAATRLAGVGADHAAGTVVDVDAGPARSARPSSGSTSAARRACRRSAGCGGWRSGSLGVRETVAAFQAEAEANWIRAQQPEIWEQTHKYLFLSGYLDLQADGRFVDSVGCQVGYVPFDYKQLRWARRCDWKWQAVPIDRRCCPIWCRRRGQLGEITAEAAAATGIPAGLPLIAAAADKACEVIGAGAWSRTSAAELRHHGDDQHHAPALHRGHPADPALPGGDPRRLQPRDPGLFAATGW